MDCAGDMNVVFYDTSSRQAWLVDGASALLHMSRAWLSSRHARYAPPDVVDQFLHSEDLNGRESALQSLIRRENRKLRLFAQSEIKVETSRDPKTGEPSQAKKTVETWWCFQDLVELKWHILEQIHDHLVNLRTSPTSDLRLPFGKQHIEGFEFVDVLSGKSPIRPKSAELKSSSGDWLEFTTNANAINIFGSDFGDLVMPSANVDNRNQSCGRYAPSPPDLDYLTAPVSVLRQISEAYSKSKGECVRLGSSTYWTDPTSSFESCSCLHASCAVNVVRFHSSPARLRKGKESLCRKNIFAQYPRGAVIFGYQPNHLLKRRGPKRKLDDPEDAERNQKKLVPVADSGIDLNFGSEAASPGSGPVGWEERVTASSWNTMDSWKNMGGGS